MKKRLINESIKWLTKNNFVINKSDLISKHETLITNKDKGLLMKKYTLLDDQYNSRKPDDWT